MYHHESSFRQYNVYADIRGDSPERGRQMTVELLSTTRIFSAFSDYIIIFSTFGDKPILLHSDMQSLVVFPLISKHWTLNDLEWLFCSEFQVNGPATVNDRRPKVSVCSAGGSSSSDHRKKNIVYFYEST